MKHNTFNLISLFWWIMNIILLGLNPNVFNGHVPLIVICGIAITTSMWTFMCYKKEDFGIATAFIIRIPVEDTLFYISYFTCGFFWTLFVSRGLWW